MALLTLADQNLIKPISGNWANASKIAGGVTNFAQLQKEVEDNDMRELLGAALLLDIQTNPATAENLLLLDGTTFENCKGETVKFEGIKFQLAYMNWSKYVFESRISDTFTGMVKKNRTESEDLSQGDLKKTQLDARKIALNDFEIMVVFLNDNSTDYPLWACANKKTPYTPKIRTVRKTYN